MINAGQDLFPVAVLPGSSTFNMTFTLGNFDSSLFELSEAENFTANASYKERVTEKLTIVSNSVTLTQTPITGSVKIAGLTEGQAAAEGVFTVSGKVVTFSGETGDIEVNYMTTSSVEEIVVDNKSSAIGSAYAVYPIYSSGDDCTTSGILGYVIVNVFRCRVSGHPSLGGSYKTASTYDFTLSAIKNTSTDHNGQAYSIAIKRVA